MTKKARVLISDLWPTWSGLMARLLSGEYEVEITSNPDAALEKLRQSGPPFHILITDIQSSGKREHDIKHGVHDLLSEVQSQSSYTKPVVLISYGGIGRQEVRTLLGRYRVPAEYCVEKFPDNGETFDYKTFVKVVAQAAKDSLLAEQKAVSLKDCEDHYRLARSKFGVLPEFQGEVHLGLCLVLLPHVETSEVVSGQIKAAIERLRIDHPELHCHGVPYEIERERKAVWEEINKASMVIADLTGLDSDIFYELGLCDALGKRRLLLVSNEQKVPGHLSVFPSVSYFSDDPFALANLANCLENPLEELIEAPDPVYVLGKNRWGLSEVKSQTALLVLPAKDSDLPSYPRNTTNLIHAAWYFYEQFMQGVLKNCQMKVIIPDSAFSSRHQAQTLWRDINRSGVMLADVSVPDPQVAYAIGLAHAQMRPIVLLTSNADTLSPHLRDLPRFEYSLAWDMRTVPAKHQELELLLRQITTVYSIRSAQDSLVRTKLDFQDNLLANDKIKPIFTPRSTPSMNSKDTFTWLHLSDLHFEDTTQRVWQIGEVTKALMDDLGQLEQEQELKPDAVFFTGDLSNKAKPEEYGKAFDACLRHILAQCKLKTADLFLVPGNHDINRAQTAGGLGFDQGLVGGIHDASTVHALLNDIRYEALRKYLLKRMDTYESALDTISDLPFDKKALAWGHVMKTRSGKEVGIIGLNSAWTSASVIGLDSEVDDRANLIVGKPLIQEALKQIERAGSKQDVRVALMHHPYDWLQEWDRWEVVQEISENCQFLLHGHIHLTSMSFLAAPNPNTMVISAGTMFKKYENRDVHTCLHAYNIVRLDLANSRGTVYFRRYDPISKRYGVDDTTFRGVRAGQYHFRYGRDGFRSV